MTQLSAATRRAYFEGNDLALGVKASVSIYEGSLLGYSAGVVRQLAAGDPFAGIAMDDATGGASDGLTYVRTRRTGRVQMALSGVAAGDVGKRVYASDGNTLTLTEGSNSAVGRIVAMPAADTIILAFNADDISLEQIALHVA